MKKLEDIPKKNIFEAPEGYFDKLPGIIQARVAEKQTTPPLSAFGFAVRFALPLLAIGLAVFLIFRDTDPEGKPEDLLATVSSEQLSFYLMESEFSTEELLDNVYLDDADINALNDEILYEEYDSEMLEDFANELQLEL